MDKEAVRGARRVTNKVGFMEIIETAWVPAKSGPWTIRDKCPHDR